MRKDAEPTQAEMITATMAFDTPECKGDTPVLVTLQNIGKEDILTAAWSFRAHQKGHSSELVNTGLELMAGGPSATDLIIKPGESVAVCSSDPLHGMGYNRDDIEYSVYVREITTASRQYDGSESTGT